MTAVDGSGLERELASAKRNVGILTVAQAILGTAGPIAFGMGGLAGHHLLGADKSLATAPLTGFNIGVAIGAIAVAWVSSRLGRRTAFMTGATMTTIGGLVAAIALFRSSFWLFAFALVLIGSSSGFTQKIRFAAADASPSFYKPRAISWILGGGVISAVLGPQISIQTKDWFEPIQFAGAFVALVPLGLLAILVLAALRLPDLKAGAAAAEPARPLSEIVLTQRFLTGMFTGISSYALMTFMMTGAPLAMVVGCGFSTDLAQLGIQWHVLGMFAPSFITGPLIARYGAEKVVAAGLAVLMVCAAVAYQGIALWNFWGSLILLGVGWNFGFIGSTAIVAQSYRPHEADKVQGFHDIILFSTVAAASAASGYVFTHFGWNVMNLIVWPFTIVGIILLVMLMVRRKRA